MIARPDMTMQMAMMVLYCDKASISGEPWATYTMVTDSWLGSQRVTRNTTIEDGGREKSFLNRSAKLRWAQSEERVRGREGVIGALKPSGFAGEIRWRGIDNKRKKKMKTYEERENAKHKMK